MNLEQLTYIVEVAKCQSINMAAKNLYISQSALSLSIQNLERELGKTIFTRSNRGVELTPFGKIFVSYLKPLNAQLEQLQNIFIFSRSELERKVSIANDGFYMVSRVIAYLFNKYKKTGIQVEHYDTYGNEARNLVAGEGAEVGVIHIWDICKKAELRQLDTMELEYFPLGQAKLAITVGEGNELYGKKPAYVTPEMLEHYPMVKYGSIEYGPHTAMIRELKLDRFGSGIVTNSRAVVSDILANTDAYILDSTWSREGAVTSHLSKGGNSLIIPLRTERDIRSEMGWIKKKNHLLSEVANDFIRLMTQEIS